MMKKALMDLLILFAGCLIYSFIKSGFGLSNMHWKTFAFVCALFYVYKGIKWILTKSY